jgi:hypothetical protein
MSLGLGIFLSAILLIMVWQIDKHGAWRKARKIAAWALAVLIVLGVTGFVWLSVRPAYKNRMELKAQVAQVRNPTDLPYWGIKVGMTKAEVKYLKGEPTETEVIGDAGKQHEVWRYTMSPSSFDEYRYSIHWNIGGTFVFAIACGEGFPSGCERIAGIGIGSTEAELRERLGAPSSDDPPKEDGTKLLTYGNGTDDVRFSLSQGKVTNLGRVRLADKLKTTVKAQPAAASPAR